MEKDKRYRIHRRVEEWLNDIRFSLMDGHVDYDELVNEQTLTLFEKISPSDTCYPRTKTTSVYTREGIQLVLDISEVKISDCVENLNTEIAMDVNTTFERMHHTPQPTSIEALEHIAYWAEEVATKLNTTAANVYNIKHRAIVQFVEVYNAC